MKKGKSRNRRKKTRSRLLWIAIAVIGIAAVISVVCVAGMLATKENAWRTPEELEYSCAVTPQVRQTGNRLSGLAGTAYASLLT